MQFREEVNFVLHHITRTLSHSHSQAARDFFAREKSKRISVQKKMSWTLVKFFSARSIYRFTLINFDLTSPCPILPLDVFSGKK